MHVYLYGCAEYKLQLEPVIVDIWLLLDNHGYSILVLFINIIFSFTNINVMNSLKGLYWQCS